MVRIILAWSLVVGLAVPAAAQLKPSSIYMFQMQQLSDSLFQFTQPAYLTGFNPNGYNNHPAFFSEDELYLSAKLPSENQPDLYLLDLEKKTKTRVTKTAEGEFSPFRMPDYYNFSAVRQEITGRDTLLRLWEFPIDHLRNGKPVFKYLTGIGYYCWVTGNFVAIYKVGNPNRLVIANTYNDQEEEIATNPGRCIRTLPNGNILYVQKSTVEPWQIIRYNRFSKERKIVTETLPGTEDFAVLPSGILLMGRGSKLFKFDPKRDKAWLEIVDLRFYGIENISRLAVSPGNKIAIVSD